MNAQRRKPDILPSSFINSKTAVEEKKKKTTTTMRYFNAFFSLTLHWLMNGGVKYNHLNKQHKLIKKKKNYR